MRRSPASTSVVLLIALCSAGFPAFAAPPDVSGGAGQRGTLADLTRKEPYLVYPGDPARMTVLWQLTGTDTARIAWGTDTTCALGSVGTAEYGIDHQHAFTLTGLTPGTKYYYRVTNQGVPHPGSFTAAPAPGTADLEFFAYGDTRTYPATHDQVAGAIVAAYGADPAAQTFALSVGDLVFDGNYESYWTSEFFNPAHPNIRRLLADLPYPVAIGNHEGTGLLFAKYFPAPFAGGRYWSFDYGPAHFVIVDQYTSYGPGSAQLRWIADDLAASAKVWKFMVLHEPGWSAGGGHPNNTSVQSYLEPLCEQYGVAIVFGGHNHYYARAVVNGVQHITTGGGGAPLHTPILGSPCVVAGASAYHYCRVAIAGGVLGFQALTPAGGLLDSFTIHRQLPDVTLPTVQVLSPDGGERWEAGSTHTITWTATDDVAVNSVDVDYSRSGADGPWIPIAHDLSNSGSTSWTLPAETSDSALVQVTARDAARHATSDVSDSLFRVAAPAAGVDGLPAGLSLAHPLPNPSAGATRFAFTLPAAGHARLEIIDPAGRRLWHYQATLGAGRHLWRWDGRSLGGAPAGVGLYFARLDTPWGVCVQHLVILR